MLRRTKDTKCKNGKAIVELPLRKVFIEYVSVSDSEREFYNALMERSKRTLLEADERKKYATAFTL